MYVHGKATSGLNPGEKRPRNSYTLSTAEKIHWPTWRESVLRNARKIQTLANIRTKISRGRETTIYSNVITCNCAQRQESARSMGIRIMSSLSVSLHSPDSFFKRKNCYSHKRHVFTHPRPVWFEAPIEQIAWIWIRNSNQSQTNTPQIVAQILLTRFFNQRIVNQCKPKAFAYAKYLAFLRFVFFACQNEQKDQIRKSADFGAELFSNSTTLRAGVYYLLLYAQLFCPLEKIVLEISSSG